MKTTEREREWKRRYRLKNKAKILARERIRRAKQSPEHRRSAKLRCKYKITLEDFDNMLQQQEGVCAICGNPEYRVDPVIKKVRNLSVDHCHKTGKVRGLLCSDCNIGLGAYRDDLYRLAKAIVYLSKQQSKKSDHT